MWLMADILYICFNSIYEPLVHSQVLAYMEGLQQKGWRFTLFTAESKMTKSEIDEMSASLRDKDINWCPIFKGRFKVLGQIRQMVNLACQWHKEEKFSLVHARSFYSALAARWVSNKIKIPYIYDIRGFWVDEKVYKGKLRQNSFLYKFLKKLDAKNYNQASGIVSLTQKAVAIIINDCFKNGVKLPIAVIPTCVDTTVFKSHQNKIKSFVYLGSVGDGYMGDVIFKVFSIVQRNYPNYKIILISRSQKKLVEKLAQNNKVDLSKISHLRLNHQQVPKELGQCTIGLSFIQPHHSKKASCATKIGEYMACGMPVLCNSGVGDMDEILSAEVAVLCDDYSPELLVNAIDDIISLSHKRQTVKLCQSLAGKYFSLKHGIQHYDKLYTKVQRLSK